MKNNKNIMIMIIIMIIVSLLLIIAGISFYIVTINDTKEKATPTKEPNPSSSTPTPSASPLDYTNDVGERKETDEQIIADFGDIADTGVAINIRMTALPNNKFRFLALIYNNNDKKMEYQNFGFDITDEDGKYIKTCPYSKAFTVESNNYIIIECETKLTDEIDFKNVKYHIMEKKNYE